MRQELELFLGRSFTEEPKQRRKMVSHNAKNLAWCFVAKEQQKAPVAETSCRTWSTLSNYYTDFTYWTPNTFYRRDHRRKDALRWLNAIFIDIDDPGIILPDILAGCCRAGLPEPTMVNKTPRGHHVYWALNPVRATPKAIALYNALTAAVAKELDADPNAVGPERYVRLPKFVQHFSGRIHDLATFGDWRDLNYNNHEAQTGAGVDFMRTGILNHPAIKHLLSGVAEGIRDNVAFTLALALKVEGYTQDQALQILQKWNLKNEPPLSLVILNKKIKSAYGGRYHGPSSKWVEQLSGIPFTYRPLTRAKTRDERKRLHLYETREMILDYICQQGGQVIMSQVELAKAIKVPLSSFKTALNGLRRGDKLSMKVEGRGRATKTTYCLVQKPLAITKEIAPAHFRGLLTIYWNSLQKIMVHTDIHPMGVVLVGGSVRGSP